LGTPSEGTVYQERLSPFIFNVVPEPLLLIQLDKMEGYQLYAKRKVSLLAFTDDLIFMAANHLQAESLLRRMQNYLQDLGLSILAHKCIAVSIRTRDSWYLKYQNLISKDGVKMLMASADATIQHLGGSFSEWKDLTEEGHFKTICLLFYVTILTCILVMRQQHTYLVSFTFISRPTSLQASIKFSVFYFILSMLSPSRFTKST
jgi:hypothetical protein